MKPRPAHAYIYRCRVDRVVDGDTLDLAIDVGFRVHTIQRVRLAGVDTPETRGIHRPAGIVVAELVHNWVESFGPTFFVETGKQAGGHGRWVGDLWALSGDHLNGWLLTERLAKPTTTTRAAWTPDEIKEISER